MGCVCARKDMGKEGAACGKADTDDGDLAFNCRPVDKGFQLVCCFLLASFMHREGREGGYTQVGFMSGRFKAKITTRTIPTAVNLRMSISTGLTQGLEEEKTYTSPAANITATPIFFCTDRFNFSTS